MNRSTWAWMLVAAWLLSGVAMAAPRFDFIMVGNSKRPADARLLHLARVKLEKIRSDLGLSSEDLPVDLYDLSNPGHLAAAERLHISKAQTPYIGLCRVGGAQSLPVKVVYGVGPVTNLDEAIAELMQQASTAMGVVVPTAGGGPVSVARDFFAALVNRQDTECWKVLTVRSQNYIIQSIAEKDPSLTEASVRAYFDRGDKDILKAYFDPFRKDLTPSDVVSAKFTLTSQQDLRAEVGCFDGKTHLKFLCFKENAEWKLGFIESILPDKFPDLATTSDPTPQPTTQPQALSNGPADAARSFFYSVATSDYKGSWTALTRETQDEFVNAIVKAANKGGTQVITAQQVRSEFQNGTLGAFWDNFRQSSHSDEVAKGTFTTASIDGAVATVTVNSAALGKPTELKVYQTAGGWKIGWKETFFPNGMGDE